MQGVYWGVVSGSAPQRGMETGLGRGESQTKAFAAEASASPARFSGARGGPSEISRTETSLGTWASAQYFSC